MTILKRVVVYIAVISCIFGIPGAVLPASMQPVETGPLTLSEFLLETELTFEEYHAMMRERAESERYPHFLAANSQRYKAFQVLNPDMPFGKVIALVNVNADIGFYVNIESVRDPYEVSALVNKNFALPSGWMPSDFVNIGGGHRLREEAAEHFSKMRTAVADAGLRLQVISTFRSYQTQAGTHSRGVARHGLASADRQFARPGHSEHQMGLALDILHRSGFQFMTQARFQYTREFAWLTENAHTFGFILRYPEQYRHIHGYIFEPWHWRFVGVEVATAMHYEGILLFEEFYGRYLAPEVLGQVRQELLRASRQSRFPWF
ncbi:MAG: M15 family metallopeptidase [Oscillospiraceae bacterium]|nr:M15 family metallopeptidase [Oscillospiraceae bacterium]